jgi:Lrp/AsnC family transcriptional regulator, leucine-responsive regulatory protein
MKAQVIDDIDRRLLTELQSEARLSHAELGRRIGLSGTSTAERLRRLEESGVIRGYAADVDPKAIGYAITAVLRIRPVLGELKKIAEVAHSTPEVVECHRITGEDCYIMKLHVHSVDALEEVLDRFTPFGQTTTSIVQSSPVPGRGIHIGS